MGLYHEALAEQMFGTERPNYAWLVTKDHLADATDDGAGTAGPRGATDEQIEALRMGAGRAFRMYDDDGELYYEGRFLDPTEGDECDEAGDGFAPLWDYGAPNAGCTEIRYFVNGRWESL